jgi:hypothetical protein
MVPQHHAADRHHVDRDAGNRRCAEAMIGVEHRREYAGKAHGNDARHEAARHMNGDAHLRSGKAVRDDRHVERSGDPSDDRPQRKNDRKRIDDGIR